MFKLNQLKNTTKIRKPRKRVGRGIGSGLGKTCGRGEKGAGSRSGYRRRYGYEGGQFRLFMKLPIRGFSNFNFRREFTVINLDQIDGLFSDNEVVNEQTLREKGFLTGTTDGIKVLGNGNLTKKVSIEVHALSKTARDKLQEAKISVTMIGSASDQS